MTHQRLLLTLKSHGIGDGIIDWLKKWLTDRKLTILYIKIGDHYRKTDIDTLERIQRATKIIPELRDLSYEERLIECGLATLETRRLTGDQTEVFKILNGYANIDRNTFFTLIGSRTR